MSLCLVNKFLKIVVIQSSRDGKKPMIERQQLERVGRMYRTDGDAAKALGVAVSTYRRQCERQGIKPAGRPAKPPKGTP